MELQIINQQAQITTPVYTQEFDQNNERNILNKKDILNEQILIQIQNNSNAIKDNQNNDQNNGKQNDKIQMIKKIRSLQKKNKDLMKTLLLLRSDGIDVERAFQQVLSGHVNDQIQAQDNPLQLEYSKATRVPKYIKNIKNKDSYQADSSIIESMDGLSLQYFDNMTQVDQNDIFYPMKNLYKSKPLNQEMKKILKLDFNVLYDDYYFCDQTQGSGENQEIEDSDTG